MIIIIKSDINIEVDTVKKARALDNILASFGECRHLVWMPRELTKSLLEFDLLSAYSKRVLHELYSFVAETKGIEQEFNFHITIDFNSPQLLQTSEECITIGYGLLCESTSLNKSILLTENLKDAELMEISARTYLSLSGKLSACKISVDQRGGGGNTTFDSFSQLERNNLFFLCIIDSDLKHPKGPTGTTAKRFKDTQHGLKNRRYLRILECHEIENLIPLAVIKELRGAEYEGSFIQKLDRNSLDRRYPDHKAGLTIKSAMEADAKHGENYWHTYYPHYNKRRKTWIIAPLGENLLSDTIEYMNKQSDHSNAKKASAVNDSMWLAVSKDVASWGICAKRPVH